VQRVKKSFTLNDDKLEVIKRFDGGQSKTKIIDSNVSLLSIIFVIISHPCFAINLDIYFINELIAAEAEVMTDRHKCDDSFVSNLPEGVVRPIYWRLKIYLWFFPIVFDEELSTNLKSLRN
jgi:hypothetical protein